MFTCKVVDNTTSESFRNHVLRGSNSVQDLITMVAVTLSKRTDEIILMHNDVVLSLSDTKLVKIFIGDIDNMTREQLGDDGNYDVDIQVWTAPSSPAARSRENWKPQGQT